MFWAKQVQQPDDQNGCSRKFFRMRYAKILKSGQRADGCRDQVIGDEEKGADDGDDFGTMAHAGVNAAPVRVKTADYHVVEAN